MNKAKNQLSKKLAEELNISNKAAVPRIEKVVVNMGVGQAASDKKILEQASNDLAKITGQKPTVRPAKISVAGFGIRAGMPVGLKVTIRGERMYDFLKKFISIALPRLRDFRGVSVDSFDKEGNYTVGIREHIVFPEIDLSETSPLGLEVTVVTSTKGKDESKKLLEAIGMPFEKEK